MSFEFEKVCDILVCPECRSELVYDGDALICVDPDNRLKYSIIDDIPRLLVDEATPLDTAQWSAVMRQHGRDPVTGTVQSQPRTEP